jgi:hypothetical protein
MKVRLVIVLFRTASPLLHLNLPTTTAFISSRRNVKERKLSTELEHTDRALISDLPVSTAQVQENY